jgi:hypothetical protein
MGNVGLKEYAMRGLANKRVLITGGASVFAIPTSLNFRLRSGSGLSTLFSTAFFMLPSRPHRG